MNSLGSNSSSSPAPEPTSPRSSRAWLRPLVYLAITASVIVLPMPFLGNASGHDFQFHLASWMEVANQWHEHILFPRWAEWGNFGFGEPRFIFYPPLSWLAGAALGSVLPWVIVPGTYLWLLLVAGGMAMWRFAREWLSNAEASAAAVFFAVNPYSLVIVYYRSDFAELLAWSLFPLLILGVLRVWRDGWSGVPLLSVVFAAIWLSNAPAGVIASYSVALLLALGTIYKRRLRPAVIGAAAMIIGLGLAAFYIVPAAYEQRWVQISEVVSLNLAPERNFIFAHSPDPEFQLFNWKVSAAAMLLLLIAGIAAVFVARRRRNFLEIWWMLLALGAAATFLMFPPSTLLWRHLPKLRFLQFPWRWLGPLGVVFAAFVASCWTNPKRRRITWAAVLALLALLASGIASDAWWDSEDVDHVADGIQSGYGYEGTDEYAPVGADIYALPGWIAPDTEPSGDPTPSVEELPDDETKPVPLKYSHVKIEKWTAVRKSFTVDADSPVTLAIRLVNYPAWHVSIDGAASPAATLKETGQMLVPIAAGKHRVEIRFVRTPDRTAGGIVSLIAAFGLIAIAKTQRGRHDRASAP